MLSTIQIVDNPRVSSEAQQIDNQQLITQQINNNYKDFQNTTARKAMLHLNETEYPNEPLNETYEGGLTNSQEEELTELLKDARYNGEGPDRTYSIKHEQGYEQHINNTITTTDQNYNTTIKLDNSYPQYQLDNTNQTDQLITTTQITTTTTSTTLQTQINQTQEITTQTKIPK